MLNPSSSNTPDFADARSPSISAVTRRPLLEVRELEKSYNAGGKTIPVLKKISFEVAAGEAVVLLGRNGAGKTTTFKIVLGLIAADSGQVVSHAPQTARTSNFGAALEGGRNLYWRLTALENLEYYGALRGMKARDARVRGRALLERFSLSEHSDKTVQKLSRGLQQRVALAVALVHSPALLVLDEPTLGIDYEGTQVLIDIIRELRSDGIGVLISTHQLSVAEAIADRTIILRDGQIAADRLTSELWRELSDHRFEIELGAALEPAQLQSLVACGARVNGQHVAIEGDALALAATLQAIGRSPLVRINHVNATLEAAYQRYTG